jgi:hypothetical protein
MVGCTQMNTQDALQALLDKQAIAEVIARYSRTLDWLDEAGQASCYWPDAAIDYGFFKGSAADFVPAVMQVERASARRWHMTSGLQIKLHDGAHASAECYGIAAGARVGEDGTYAGTMYGGRYLDEFEARGGEWRIAKRDYALDWSLPLPDQPVPTPGAAFPLPMLEILASGHPQYRVM